MLVRQNGAENASYTLWQVYYINVSFIMPVGEVQYKIYRYKQLLQPISDQSTHMFPTVCSLCVKCVSGE